MNHKECHHCQKILPPSEFYDRPKNICKVCLIKKAKIWRKTHAEQYKEYFKIYRIKNRDRVNQNIRTYHRRIRKEAISGYGGKCTCCGENNIGFLTIDHINGNGNEHRKVLRKEMGGQTIYRFLINGGFPKGFQVLCYNCNCGQEYNSGICPHKIKIKESNVAPTTSN